jgi:two-component system sensor histidine kinase RpfC
MSQERSARVIGPGLLLDGSAPADRELRGLTNEPIGVIRMGPGAHETLDGYLAVLAPDADDRLVLAAMRAALAAPQVPDAETRPPSATRDRPSRHVLVAEDNRINQKVIERMLSSGGHLVTLVGDGEQALDALEAGSFDLVLMDLNMPVMGGLDALKLHRFATGGRGLPPFVALTADATEETRRKCVEAGMDACLTKPVDVAHLLDLVDRLTRSRPDEGGGRMAQGAEVVPYPRWGDGTPVLDRAYLDRLRQLDPEDDFLVAIIEDFIADAEHLIDELGAAAGAGDAGTFRDRAHALRSSAAHIGASALFELCLGWRGMSSTELGKDGAAHVARLGSEFERLRTALLAVLAELSPSGRPALRQPH